VSHLEYVGSVLRQDAAILLLDHKQGLVKQVDYRVLRPGGTGGKQTIVKEYVHEH
jgi:hypothetical protein